MTCSLTIEPTPKQAEYANVGGSLLDRGSEARGQVALKLQDFTRWVLMKIS